MLLQRLADWLGPIRISALSLALLFLVVRVPAAISRGDILSETTIAGLVGGTLIMAGLGAGIAWVVMAIIRR